MHDSMPLPDYRGGSLVNLMASLERGLGGSTRGPGRARYPELALAPAERFRETRKVVLFVIDGLGYQWLLDTNPGGVLREHLAGSLTSVFPSTTASAITTLLSGCAPQDHCLTGWFMWFKEIGAVGAPLPFKTRSGGHRLAATDAIAFELLRPSSIFSRLPVKCFIVQPRHLVNTTYTRTFRGRAEVQGFESLEEYFQVTTNALRGKETRFIYAYWAQLDALAHVHGVASARVRRHLGEIDRGFARFLESTRGAGVTVLVTADHGFIDTEPDTQLHLDQHPVLRDALLLPLCGEPRVAYCYVKPHAIREFEDYVSTELAFGCTVLAREEMIGAEYFGLGPPAPRLRDRIGDYALVMKENFAIHRPTPGTGIEPSPYRRSWRIERKRDAGAPRCGRAVIPPPSPTGGESERSHRVGGSIGGWDGVVTSANRAMVRAK